MCWTLLTFSLSMALLKDSNDYLRQLIYIIGLPIHGGKHKADACRFVPQVNQDMQDS